MGNIVKFIFTKFVQLDKEGNEKDETFGYRIFDEYGQYSNDTLTLHEVKIISPQKALSIIEEEYDELYELVLDKGFYLNDVWISVDETGTIMEEKQ